ncbi:MAG TPA: T9SS type A sorting domain-containing protein [Dinghuibacter sp.]|uniref:T9SS type A sorting domain-containing protein n=1 Tax=Dinghuibacter sp. TaxID=2024697 RepID=UPI002CB4F855|nr:T9SS type A sorting domain-containing protein [Dinghuibacter sp.]HTJ12963.1 T9SS type A sorting domain-containing protein [Dinghuibacter sp.]
MKAVPLVYGFALFICSFFLCLPSRGQTKYFVTQTGTGAGVGSWASAAGAAQLQGILAGAASGDTIWIAMGVYHPTAYPAGSTGGATNRDFAFTIASGVAVYGGFVGTETFLTDRTAGHTTSFSGDIGTAGYLPDDCYHVLVGTGLAATTLLDDIKIDSGYANGTGSISLGGQAFGRTLGGGIFMIAAEPTLSNCTIANNQANGEGGGLYLSNCTALLIKGCAFSGNTALSNGGAVSKETASPVTFDSCTFTGNWSFVAAGISGGGGIYSAGGSGDLIEGCLFSADKAFNAYGGAVFYNGTGALTMTRTTLTGNTASSFGGGLANVGGAGFDITHCNFSANTSAWGGGVYSSGTGGTYAWDTLQGNTATSTNGAGGGGFYNDAANPVVSHCLFQNNTTGGGNGAGQYDNGAAAPIDSNTVFQSNSAQGNSANGGGYYHAGGAGLFLNCVFVDNSASGDGGGYYNNSVQPVESCTFYHNTAGTTGGGVYDEGGEQAKYYNNMLWGNTPNSFGLGGGSTAQFTLLYNDFPESGSYAGSTVVGNLAQAPTFYDASSYAGPDGQWGTIDDGLHLASPSGTGGTDAVPPAGSFGSVGWPADDIADAARPDAGANLADMGAYEGTVIPLALSLVQFYADGLGVLHWSVAAPAASFVLTRSSDGWAFSPVASLGGSVMSYADTSVAPVFYYKLEVMLADGSTQWSGVVTVRRGPGLAQLRPNPVVSSATLYVPAPGNANIFDASGRLLRVLSLATGNNPLSFAGLAPGTYFLELDVVNGLRQVIPFVKE